MANEATRETTRQLTTKTALELRASGMPLEKITVDLILDTIRQGSRTTINDELRKFKEKQSKLDAVSTGLPPEVTNATRELWALAVSLGEKVFQEQKMALEAEITALQARETALVAELSTEKQYSAELRAENASRITENNQLREDLAATRSVADSAIARNQALEEQLSTQKSESTQRESALQAEHRRREFDLHEQIAASKKSHQEELSKTMGRLESVQQHVLMQVEEARANTRRVEAALAKETQRTGELNGELQALRERNTSLQNRIDNDQALLANADSNLKGLQSEREQLIKDVASLTARLESSREVSKSLEERVALAESRLHKTTGEKKDE